MWERNVGNEEWRDPARATKSSKVSSDLVIGMNHPIVVFCFA